MKMKSLSLVLASLVAIHSPVRADDSAHQVLSRAEVVRREVATREAQEKVNELREQLSHQLDLQSRGQTLAGEQIRVSMKTLALVGFLSSAGILVFGPTRGGKSIQLKPGARNLLLGTIGMTILSFVVSSYSEELVSLAPGEAENLVAQLEMALEHLEQEKAKLAQIRMSLAN